MKKSLIAGAIGAVMALPGHAVELLKTDTTTVNFGGFIKASYLYSDFSDGVPSSSSTGRVYYIPSTIPVSTTGDTSSDPVTDFTARESRFNFGTDTKLDGHNIKTFIELDFLSGFVGDERVSNSTAPRLRQAYMTYDNWLFGQTFTTFENTKALPETADFLAPSDSTACCRQPMVRYTSGNWQFALENPETTYSAYDSSTRVDEDNSVLPDFIARYGRNGDWGNFTIAGLVRQLRIDSSENAAGDTLGKQTAVGYGVSFAGMLKVGDMDDLKYSLAVGDGIGRYVALNTFNGASIDASGDLDTISTVSAFIAYRHFWNPKLRSTFMLSGSSADNNSEMPETMTKSVGSVHANIVYSPVKPLTFSTEYIYGQRKLESGDKGTLNRVEFSAKYAF
ncbi:DcaP family trimeric outer membrane transporter [Gallaecimonas mangrovi]|uniref:DcaP family trimeric outer membrane transporter n=1 Tax=Gallaecimonas mangrovi TaxID=2291597 RepID=UPI000E1FDEDB|nr:DcaP family trimeric outer membrane transporter [Gallaecimonas mangrovi]